MVVRKDQSMKSAREGRGHCGGPGRLQWGHACAEARPGLAGHTCTAVCYRVCHVHAHLCVCTGPVSVRG